MNTEECFQKRLLRRIRPDMEKASVSMSMAGKKKKLAAKALNAGIFESCIIAAYTAMFHAARAALYRDGVQEKSHKCTAVYLREMYGDKIPAHLLNAFDVHRIDRHEALYGLDFEPTEEDSRSAVRDAGEFIAALKPLLDRQAAQPPAG